MMYARGQRGLQGMVLLLLLTRCMGTEVGNGLKIPDPGIGRKGDDPEKTSTHADASVVPEQPGQRSPEPSPSIGGVDAVVSLADIRVALLQSCGSVFSRQNPSLSRALYAHDKVLQRDVLVFNTRPEGNNNLVTAPETNQSWVVAQDADGTAVLNPSGMMPDSISDLLTCRDVTQAFVGRNKLTGEVIATYFVYLYDKSEVDKINPKYVVSWSAAVLSESEPALGEYDLKTVEVIRIEDNVRWSIDVAPSTPVQSDTTDLSRDIE